MPAKLLRNSPEYDEFGKLRKRYEMDATGSESC
jgi:hypothetical protein